MFSTNQANPIFIFGCPNSSRGLAAESDLRWLVHGGAGSGRSREAGRDHLAQQDSAPARVMVVGKQPFSSFLLSVV